MRALVVLVLLLVSACKVKEDPKPTPPAPTAIGSVVGGAFMPGHVIVKMKPGATFAPEALARMSLVKVKDLSLGATLYRVDGMDAGDPDARPRTIAIVNELKKDPSVEYAQLDHVMTFQ